MANPVAEIVFVGLCSLLNVQNAADPNLPPPSIVLPADSHHIPMIAFDSLAVAVDARDAAGKVILPKDVQNTPYRYFVLTGEQLVVRSAQPGIPRPALSLAAVPSIHEYSPESVNDTWDPDVIPKRVNGTVVAPSKNRVAGFLLLREGDVSAGQVTRVPWEFRTQSNDRPTIRGHFAHEVVYSFPGDLIELTAAGLDGKSSRTFRFEGPSGGKNIRIWIGNVACHGCDADGIVRALTGDFHPPYKKADHYAKHYGSLNQSGQPAKAVVRIPYPLRDAGTQPALASKGGKPSDDDAGYCGPDQKP